VIGGEIENPVGMNFYSYDNHAKLGGATNVLGVGKLDELVEKIKDTVVVAAVGVVAIDGATLADTKLVTAIVKAIATYFVLSIRFEKI
jgi:hypothetical protein